MMVIDGTKLGLVDTDMIYPEQHAWYFSELYDREAEYVAEHGE